MQMSNEDAEGYLEAWLLAPSNYRETIPWMAALDEANYASYRDSIATRSGISPAQLDEEVGRFRTSRAPGTSAGAGFGVGAPQQPQQHPFGRAQQPYPGAPQQQPYPGAPQQQPYPGAPQQQPYTNHPGPAWGNQGWNQPPHLHPAPHYPLAPMPPSAMACPRCGSGAAPYVDRPISAGGWTMFVVLFLFCTPICWIPLLFMKDTRHRCPQCRSLR